jgi:hypothetical protein
LCSKAWSFHLVPVILQDPFNLVYLLTLFFAQAFVFFDYMSRPSSLLKGLANFAGTKETKAMSDNALVKREDEGAPEDTLQRHHSIKITKPWPPRKSDGGPESHWQFEQAGYRIRETENQHRLRCGEQLFCLQRMAKIHGGDLGRQREMKLGVWGCRWSGRGRRFRKDGGSGRCRWGIEGGSRCGGEG